MRGSAYRVKKDGGIKRIAVVVREWNMKTLVLFASTLAILVAPLTVRAEQPPIIDRNLFFGEVEISGEQISPDGQFISFLKPYKGTRNIWVKKTSEPFSAARPVSAEVKRPVRGHFWSRDSKFILYSQDAGGDENFNVYAIDPALAADPVTGVPPTRALTNLQGVRTVIYSLPRAKPDIIYIGLNDRDARWHDLYELRLSTGEKTLLRKNTERITNWVFDHDATLRLAVRLAEVGDKEFLRVDPDGFKGDLQLRCAGRLWPGGFRRAEQAGLSGDQQGAAESDGIGYAGSGDRRHDAGRKRSAKACRLRGCHPLRRRLSRSFHKIRGRRRSAVLQGPCI